MKKVKNDADETHFPPALHGPPSVTDLVGPLPGLTALRRGTAEKPGRWGYSGQVASTDNRQARRCHRM